MGQSQNGITARLIDENGNGIPGANIILEGTTIGTVTDSEGKFTINNFSSSTLIISSNGITNYEFKIVEEDYSSDKSINLMISENEIITKFWCCTSHQPSSTHCDKNRSELRTSHSSSEIYKIKIPRN